MFCTNIMLSQPNDDCVKQFPVHQIHSVKPEFTTEMAKGRSLVFISRKLDFELNYLTFFEIVDGSWAVGPGSATAQGDH
jgi:hypothetical protein